MSEKIKNFFLIILILYSAMFVVVATLSPIFAHIGEYDLSAKFTTFLMYSCHQKPERTFWIFGYPMALCARCYGFYIGVVVSFLFAIFNKLKIGYKLALCFFVVSITDIVLNYVFSINTGNFIRFLSGILMGIIFSLIVCFLIKKEVK